jgi:hypothetical protein
MSETPQTARAVAVRRYAAVTLIVIGSLLIALSVPAVWVNRTLMNTENWVETVAPLASEPAIQDAVATTLSDSVLGAIDVGGLLERYLPDDALPLAAPLGGAVETFVRAQVVDFTRSDAFVTAWVEANRLGHSAVVAAVTDREGGVLTNQSGTVAIQLGPVTEAFKQRLAEKGMPAFEIPTQVANQEIILFASPALGRAGRAVEMMQRLAFWIPAAGLLAFGIAVLLALDRRRAVLLIGIGTLAATALPLQALYLGRIPVVAAVQRLGASQASAATVAYDIVFRDLFAAERLLAFAALGLIIAAIAVGPAPLAVKLRGAASGGLAGVSARYNFGVIGEFFSANRRALRGIGLIMIAVLLLLPGQRTVGFMIGLALAALVWIAVVEVLGSGNAPIGDDEGAAR